MSDYQTDRDRRYKEKREQFLLELTQRLPISYIADNFPNYARRQDVTRFLVRHELYKQILNLKGSIIECGVLSGAGLMGWAQLAAILEPVGFWRHIYGFDTFEGFPSVHANDRQGKALDWKTGDLKDESYDALLKCIELYDDNRFLEQFPKVSLVRGDFTKTADTFVKENPHVLVALLYLDFDLYEPTRKALEVFLPRMGKGSILAFDEINNPHWPGETTAFLESVNIRDLRIQKFPYEPNMAYIIL